MAEALQGTSSSRNVFQQVFGVSLSSNIIQNCTGTSEDLQLKLAAHIPDALKLAGDGWKVVWGPVVWKPKSTREDTTYGNAWYVAKKDSIVFENGTLHTTYVVSIAATSGMYDYVHEDAAIKYVVDVDTWAGQGAKGLSQAPKPIRNDFLVPKNRALISHGFSRGVYQILNNTPPKESPGYSHTLPQFLQSLQFAPSEHPPKLVFAGHSLGGALAPSLAYTLLKADCLGPFSKDLENVHVYPTAGPTPGNTVFAQSFKEHFPPRISAPDSSYQRWNVNIINRLDIVPCAYCVDPKYGPEVLSNIPGMYGNLWLIVVEITVAWLRYMAHGLYVPIDLSRFSNSHIPKPPKKPKDVWAYLDAAHLQHVDAYGWEILNEQIPDPICKKPKKEDWSAHPVLGHIVRRQNEIRDRSGIAVEEIFEEPQCLVDE
ncbi:hypothetical protein B0J17DRAFT_755963 [Rhizoctonia solani]|nr:hypothetical protein B0J17DRAFT_755963 [Rhizoctonia solani]